MTPEERMIHKAISQILADNGINRDTIHELVKEVISEKACKVVELMIKKSEIDDQLRSCARYEISKAVKDVVRDALYDSRPLMRISVEMQGEDAHKPNGEVRP